MDEALRQELLRACRLGLRAAYHACDHPLDLIEKGAQRGCGACRAAVALQAAIGRLEAIAPRARKGRARSDDSHSRRLV